MEATAFDRHTITAAGTIPHAGIVAADPSILPLGTRIRISGAGVYRGIYTVRDTGGKVVGRHIDIYVPDAAAARMFGKKIVTVRVLRIGTQEAPRKAISASVER